MPLQRKSSQPRKTQLATSLPPLPDSAPEDLKAWFNGLKGAIDEDRETIEARFAEMEKERASSTLAAQVTALEEQFAALTSAPVDSRLIIDGMVSPVAAIQESKLALGFATHSPANDPTADQKAALVGTSGTPGATNKYVTNSDPRIGTLMTFPPGAILAYLGATVPDGWLEADGSAVDRFSYAALFEQLGTTYGVGDGTSTFNLPDFRGRALIGEGTGAGLTARTLGEQTIGVEDVILTSAQSGLPAHQHDILCYGDDSGTSAVTGSTALTGPSTQQTEMNVAADASASHDNMSPSAVVRWICKY